MNEGVAKRKTTPSQWQPFSGAEQSINRTQSDRGKISKQGKSAGNSKDTDADKHERDSKRPGSIAPDTIVDAAMKTKNGTLTLYRFVSVGG